MDQDRLSRLGAFAEIFEADGFKFAELRGREESSPGVFQMPWYDLSEPAATFTQLCYDDGWVLPNFDWMEWSRTPEASAPRDDPEAVGKATAEQLAKLLTMRIRADRFCDGALAEAFDAGLLLRVTRRAQELAKAG